jgi:tRNA wybutosine-synthesizing protein 1
MSESDGSKQVSDPEYHSENHTAAQTCGWTANLAVSILFRHPRSA